MKARRRRTLLAVVLSFQGETERRHFFNRRAALEWLEIEAPAIFLAGSSGWSFTTLAAY